MSIASAFIGESSYHCHESEEDHMSDSNPKPHTLLATYQLDTTDNVTPADFRTPSPHCLHSLHRRTMLSPSEAGGLVSSFMRDPMAVAGALTPALVLVPELRMVSSLTVHTRKLSTHVLFSPTMPYSLSTVWLLWNVSWRSVTTTCELGSVIMKHYFSKIMLSEFWLIELTLLFDTLLSIPSFPFWSL